MVKVMKQTKLKLITLDALEFGRPFLTFILKETLIRIRYKNGLQLRCYFNNQHEFSAKFSLHPFNPSSLAVPLSPRERITQHIEHSSHAFHSGFIAACVAIINN